MSSEEDPKSEVAAESSEKSKDEVGVELSSEKPKSAVVAQSLSDEAYDDIFNSVLKRVQENEKEGMS